MTRARSCTSWATTSGPTPRCRARPPSGDVTTTPGDDAGRALLDTYESITGETHADPDEFFAAMVAEHRLVLTLVPTSVVGSGW